MAEINVTPLMDLTFLLLIVFIITAPMLQYGVDVSPPRLDAEKIDQNKTAVIAVNARGMIVFQEETVSLDELGPRLRLWRQTHPAVAVLIAADETRPYREVMDVMRTVRHAGIANVSLLTQGEAKKKDSR